MIVGRDGRHGRCTRSAGAARWGCRPTTGLRPVPGGGSAPATLENRFLEGGDIGERRVPPVGRARIVAAGSGIESSHSNPRAGQTETAFTQNT
jgi:hypothetical protein